MPLMLLAPKLQARFPLLFAVGGFRWLWLATLVSGLGNWFGLLALNIYVYDRTGSATAIAGLMAAQAIPALLAAGLGIVAFVARRRRDY